MRPNYCSTCEGVVEPTIAPLVRALLKQSDPYKPGIHEAIATAQLMSLRSGRLRQRIWFAPWLIAQEASLGRPKPQ